MSKNVKAILKINILKLSHWIVCPCTALLHSQKLLDWFWERSKITPTIHHSKQTLENGYQDGAESLGMLQFYLLVKLNILIHGISQKEMNLFSVGWAISSKSVYDRVSDNNHTLKSDTHDLNSRRAQTDIQMDVRTDGPSQPRSNSSVFSVHCQCTSSIH